LQLYPTSVLLNLPILFPVLPRLIWIDGHPSQRREGTTDNAGLAFPLLFWHRSPRTQQN